MCRMLIVEDNVPFRSILKEMLKTGFPGSSIIEAANGREAMERFEDSMPQIIFLDIKLPDTTGLHLAKHMRGSSPAAHIFVLTSFDLPEYRNAAEANGANHFLVKGSVTSNEILELVGSVVANVHRPGPI